MAPLVLIAALLSSCQSGQQDTAGRRWIGQTLPPIADVTTLHLPEQLEGFALQGEMAGARGTKRVALYHHGDSGVTLTLALYSLPGGWDDYSAERRVSGHYIQVRNDLGRRLLKRGAQSVKLITEHMSDSDAPSPVLAGAIIEAQPPTGTPRIAFVLSCTDQVFVVISQEGTSELAALAPLEHLATLMVERLAQASR